MRARRNAALLAVPASVLLLAACTPRTAPAVAAGKRIFEGQAFALSASPDGSRLAWLTGCAAAGKGAPGCVLLAAPAEGGAPERIADGVAASPGAFAWTPDGGLLALAGRDPLGGAADLVLWRPGSAPRRLAGGVTAFAAGPGAVAFVGGAEAWLARTGSDPVRLPGGKGAVEVAIAPGPGGAVAARARGADGAPSLLLWRGGSAEPAVVARDAGSFAFSPDGAWLAAVAGVVPGREGDLLAIPVVAGGPSLVLGRAVGPFQWAPAGGRLAWLEGFDARGNAGRLAAARPGDPAAVLGERVTAFELSPGGAVAFVRHVTQGGYAAHLDLATAGGGNGSTVASDPAGFAFAAGGSWLVYRAGCSPAGDSCALERIGTGAPGGSRAPERLADKVASFAVAPGTAERVLLSGPPGSGGGADLSAWTGGRVVPLDRKVLPGSPVLLAPDGRRAAWISLAPERPGVVVADLP